ncbi:MAG: Na(+)/H(+) antiporter subunit B [Notoacmeibacter sp.]|nr:Na(+)/H(+) antiporter subunit B [Notoacmeibacter sp.]
MAAAAWARTAASAGAMASGVPTVRRALRVPPTSFAGFGVFIAAIAGFLSLGVSKPFLTGLWTYLHLGENEIALSTPMLFDIGVYFAVFGTISAVALTLQEED